MPTAAAPTAPSVPTERRSPADYFAAAVQILGDEGAGGLTTTNLCARLGVTRGSLYHHFASSSAFQAAFLHHWEHELLPAQWAEVDAVTDPVARLGALKAAAVGGPHATEKAMRAWAATDDRVAAMQRRVDRRNEASLADRYVEAGLDADRAATIARIGFCILLGSQQFDEHLDRDRLSVLLDEYERWLLAAIDEEVQP